MGSITLKQAAEYCGGKVAPQFENITFFGANFIDYIGFVEKISMVKPSNGVGYDAHLFTYYFDTIIEGKAAATADTEAVIAMIGEIPERVSRADEAKIKAARDAYNKITSIEQQALVTNYASLTRAEADLRKIIEREDLNLIGK